MQRGDASRASPHCATGIVNESQKAVDNRPDGATAFFVAATAIWVSHHPGARRSYEQPMELPQLRHL